MWLLNAFLKFFFPQLTELNQKIREPQHTQNVIPVAISDLELNRVNEHIRPRYELSAAR